MALASTATSGHAERSTRIHRSSPGRMCEPTTVSPRREVMASSTAWRRSSTSTSTSGSPSTAASAVASVLVSADDNWLTLPTLGHVLVGDALLEEDDPLQQGLGPRRAPRDVD